MIDLTGKKLAGLARGVEIFKSVKNADDRMRDEGFLGEAGLLDNGGPLDARRMWGQSSEPERDKLLSKAGRYVAGEDLAQSGWEELPSDVRGAISVYMGCKNTSDEKSISLDADQEYPHNVVPNKLENGLGRGSKKYGERKNSDKASIITVGGGAKGWLIRMEDGKDLGPYPSYSAAYAEFKRRNLVAI